MSRPLTGLGIFGSGIDGDVGIGSNTTLARDMYYANLTVSSGFTLTTAGFRIFVRGTLNLIGKIERNGNDATSASGASALSNGTCGIGTAGGQGNQIAAGAAGTANTNSFGGAGGAGGSGSFAGGAAGAIAAPAETNGGTGVWRAGPAASRPEACISVTRITGGSGGGGGGGGGAGLSGGGAGGGAGTIILCAQYITGTGSIEAIGGDGYQGAIAGGAGGGGGGGGGAICVNTLTRQDSVSITLNVSGGVGGASFDGGATDGADGSAGRTYWNCLIP